jgi:hypothetical protein
MKQNKMRRSSNVADVRDPSSQAYRDHHKEVGAFLERKLKATVGLAGLRDRLAGENTLKNPELQAWKDHEMSSMSQDLDAGGTQGKGRLGGGRGLARARDIASMTRSNRRTNR